MEDEGIPLEKLKDKQLISFYFYLLYQQELANRHLPPFDSPPAKNP